jgi:RimJ/RimL family protein N-acetyltransferase
MDTSSVGSSGWRLELPMLSARQVTLREPAAEDARALVDLLSLADASRFEIEEPLTDQAILQWIDRIRDDRAAGLAFTYAVTTASRQGVVGLVQVRQLDPAFEGGEWEFTLAPSVRGTGMFVETATLVASFAFESVGVRRLEARVLLQNGRANGALRKLGAVQEGILRQSTRRRGEYMDQVLWAVLKDEWGEHQVSTAPRQ